jgi:hypothetical protein
MHRQPSFLKHPDENLRLFLQLQGFMQNTYLDFASEFVELKTFKLPEISLIEKEVESLKLPNYLRLGNRLERFFSFIIQQSNEYVLIAENLQIIEDKITLGELDFIVKDLKSNQNLHVELGGKLYLYFPENVKVEDQWIGPNRMDSLHRKLKILKEKQFPLLHHPKTIEILQNKDISVAQIEQKVCFKVRMFLPKDCNKIPSYVKKENIFGYYISFQEFLNPDFGNHLYFMPEKQDWIVEPKNGEVWFSYNEILPQVIEMHKQNQSPMLWVNKGEIIETLFVLFW